MKSEELIIFLLKILILFAIVITLLLAGFIISGGQGDNFSSFVMGAGLFLSVPTVLAGLFGLFAKRKPDQRNGDDK